MQRLPDCWLVPSSLPISWDCPVTVWLITRSARHEDSKETTLIVILTPIITLSAAETRNRRRWSSSFRFTLMEDRHTNVFSLKKLPWPPVVMLFFCFDFLDQTQNLFLLCRGPVGAKSRRATEPPSSRSSERLERSAALVQLSSLLGYLPPCSESQSAVFSSRWFQNPRAINLLNGWVGGGGGLLPPDWIWKKNCVKIFPTQKKWLHVIMPFYNSLDMLRIR